MGWRIGLVHLAGARTLGQDPERRARMFVEGSARLLQAATCGRQRAEGTGGEQDEA